LNYTHHMKFAKMARQEGERPDRRRGREKGGERVAAVKISRANSEQEILGTATGHDANPQ